MVAHRKVCPLELVQCEYYVVGCENLVARGDLENHYNKKVAEHLSLMKSKLVSTNKALAESEKKLMTIGKELNATRKALNNIKTCYITASVYLNAIFTKFNSCVLAIMMLFMFVCACQLKLIDERLFQSEQYTS